MGLASFIPFQSSGPCPCLTLFSAFLRPWLEKDPMQESPIYLGEEGEEENSRGRVSAAKNNDVLIPCSKLHFFISFFRDACFWSILGHPITFDIFGYGANPRRSQKGKHMRWYFACPSVSRDLISFGRWTTKARAIGKFRRSMPLRTRAQPRARRENSNRQARAR